MKLKKLIATLSIAGVLSIGATAMLSNTLSKSYEASADTITGSLIVKLGNIGKWSQSSAKLCAYMTDDSSSSWTSLQVMSSDTILYKFDYSLSFTPTKLIWVRMNPSETQGSWDSGKKWNQTGDLGWREATYLQDQWDPTTSQCNQWTLSAEVRSNQIPSFGTKTTLSKIGINSDGNPEVSGSVSLVLNEEFKMLAGDGVWSGYYGRPDALKNCFSGGSMTERSDSNPNIKCLVAGTYDFFFDTETKRVWLTRQDIVDADGWATYFNGHVGCDASGQSLPSGWTTVSSAYSSLSSAAKDYVYGGTADTGGDNLGRALATYDYAVAHHSELTKFITDGSGSHRRGAAAPKNPIVIAAESGSVNTIAIVVIVSVISVSAIGGYFFLKRRKEN